MLAPQPEGIPLPRPTQLSEPYWAGCRERRLRFQRCSNCARPLFDPAMLCPACSSKDLVWETSSGLGTIYSWTVAWRPMSPAFVTPYVPVIVTLDEGWQMISALIDCETTDARVGLPVEVVFQAYEDLTLPYFHPRSG